MDEQQRKEETETESEVAFVRLAAPGGGAVATNVSLLGATQVNWKGRVARRWPLRRVKSRAQQHLAKALSALAWRDYMEHGCGAMRQV